MAISIVQKSKNYSAYQVAPLAVTLPSPTTIGSYLVVVVGSQKSGSPYNLGSLGAHIPNPILTDNKSNIYTTVDSAVGISQETNGLLVPDASGYFSSAYIYVTAAAANTQTVSVAAFYPDEYVSPLQPGGNLASPPNVNGRPVFDGGLHAQVFEVAGLTTGVDVHGHTTSNSATLGASLITSTAAALILEAGILIDSHSLGNNVNATLQYSNSLGSSSFTTQTRIVGSATASGGFSNALRYTGSVVAISLK